MFRLDFDHTVISLNILHPKLLLTFAQLSKLIVLLQSKLKMIKHDKVNNFHLLVCSQHMLHLKEHFENYVFSLTFLKACTTVVQC